METNSEKIEITRAEALDLLYAVIEGVQGFINAYSDADGERLSGALRSTFRIVERSVGREG